MANLHEFGELQVDVTEVDRLKAILFELAFPNTEERSSKVSFSKFPVALPSTLSRRDLGFLRSASSLGPLN